MLQFTQLVYASEVSINWNNNSESDLAGYKVYYGPATHNYQNMLDVGLFTSAVIDGLSEGVTYYFAVTAYDTSGNESAPSQEVQATISASSSSMYTLTITKKVTGTGTVTASPTGTTFSAGTSVTLTATPDATSTFVGWSGGYSGASGNRCFLVMNNDVSVSAAFNLRTYTITASAGHGGSISPTGTISASYGSYRAFVFTPSTGYRIRFVTIDGIKILPITSYTFNNIRANHRISVSFIRVNK